MSQCLVDRYALTLYDPEEHREVVHFFRKPQGAPDNQQAERITHQRMAELLCMDGRGYELALERFDKLCAGEPLKLLSLYEYWLDPADAEVVERNNAAALAEWDALLTRAGQKGITDFDITPSKEHKEGASWKRVALSIRKFTTSVKMNEQYERDVVTRAHLLSLAAEFERTRTAQAVAA